MTTTHDRPASRTDELELAGLLLATVPRLLKMSMSQGEASPLPVNRAAVMWQLRERPMRSGEIAQRCVMTAPALTEIVDALAADAFVRRLEDPNDRRVVLVELTNRGRRELDRQRDYMKGRIARVLGSLSHEKRARLHAALADLHDAIEATAKETKDAR